MSHRPKPQSQLPSYQPNPQMYSFHPRSHGASLPGQAPASASAPAAPAGPLPAPHSNFRSGLAAQTEALTAQGMQQGRWTDNYNVPFFLLMLSFHAMIFTFRVSGTNVIYGGKERFGYSP